MQDIKHILMDFFELLSVLKEDYGFYNTRRVTNIHSGGFSLVTDYDGELPKYYKNPNKQGTTKQEIKWIR